jgi:hypothetical protein
MGHIQPALSWAMALGAIFILGGPGARGAVPDPCCGTLTGQPFQHVP